MDWGGGLQPGGPPHPLGAPLGKIIRFTLSYEFLFLGFPCSDSNFGLRPTFDVCRPKASVYATD